MPSSHRTLRRRMQEIRAGRVAYQIGPLGAVTLGMGITTPRVVAAASGNWWQAGGYAGAYAAWQGKNAASYAASKVDLTGNGRNLFIASGVGGIDPFWSAAGWQTEYQRFFTTGLSLGSGYSTLIQFSGGSGSGSCVMGYYDDPSNGSLSLFSGSVGQRYYFGGTANQAVTPDVTSGNMGITAAGRCFYNGVLDATLTPNWSGVTPYPIYIGALNEVNAAFPYPFIGTIQAAMIGTGSPSDSQMTALAAAMAAL